MVCALMHKHSKSSIYLYIAIKWWILALEKYTIYEYGGDNKKSENLSFSQKFAEDNFASEKSLVKKKPSNF